MGRVTIIAAAAFVVGLLAPSQHVSGEEISFRDQILPILSDKCYFCHGPDSERREADLRLDTLQGAKEAIESGEVLRRIHSDDEYELMPPPESNLSLSTAEKELLKKWIDSGAEYEQHWAFQPLPSEVPVPEDQASAQWAHQPFDRLLHDFLSRRNREPSSEATPERWLRRVTFDLTGLPPTPEEIQAFTDALATAKDTEAAYAAVVDRLLASPAFGEHMAVAWLGAARYADSYGYQSDKLNTQWPYRDWVVRALNANLPYDEFLEWQLAGDLLTGPDGKGPTRDQRLATSFNRLHRLNNEGGAVFKEWRLENVADRVHTFGTAVLGLTMECSRCHDHKYDPIPTRDFYALSAFFNSIEESGVYDRTPKVPCPSLLLPNEGQATKLEQVEAELAAAESAYTEATKAAGVAYEEWAAANEEELQPRAPILTLNFDQPYTEKLEPIYSPSQSDRAKIRSIELVPCEDNPLPWLKQDSTQTVLADDKAAAEEAAADKASEKAVAEDVEPVRHALKLDGDRGVTTKKVVAFDRWAPFSVVLTMRETKRQDRPVVIAHHTSGTDCGYNGWDLMIDGGHLESRMYRVWPGNAIGVRTVEPIPADQWHQVAATYDGSSRAGGLRLYLNGKPLEVRVLRDRVKKSANVRYRTTDRGELIIGQRFRDRGLKGGLIDDVRVYDADLTSTELQSLATGKAVEPTVAYYQNVVDPAVAEAFTRLTKARGAVVMTEERLHEIPVMEEMPEPRETHVLARGAYDAETSDETLVGRDTLSSIGPAFPEDAPRDRRGLARWVTLPDHPLTARVAVNRVWMNFFGYGLVRTPDNFGRQGEQPTHPKLLDWLARDYVNNGWDTKRLCKQIALSSTYRQDSRCDKQLLADDPENRLLARGPAYRLAAEQIRDLALAASGLLNPQRGGRPVSPYQPGGDLWRESNKMSPAYKQSVGVSLYRRSLYSVWKRTAPLPNMLAFDAETREVCSVARSRTNTPMQALVLLNDTQFVEASRAMADSLLLEDVDTAARIDLAFQRLAGRSPDEREGTLLAGLYDVELTHYQQDPEAAQALLSVGDSERPSSVPTAEAAAMTMVCRAILNLDATVWKR